MSFVTNLLIMQRVIGTLCVLVIGAVIGLGMTYYVVDNGAAFGSLTFGSWTMRPEIGTANADPYARASIAHVGRLPIAIGDGVSFTAAAADDGKVLDGRCDVIVVGMTPAARFWTLSLYSISGELVANSVNRHGFTSQEIVRQANGNFSITVGAHASAGNWLPSGGIERYLLVLRLYDTPVGIATKTSHEISMPSITTKNCP